ncbi:MAG: alpha/beta hydrolase-fold protein, partial [Acholeplasmataceae bacterium]|nr:alpha/beta hydrolase-fold protein [Acholeplasmataceae bacterium]
MKKICIEKCFIPTTLDERTIRVLLPDDYESTNKSYGVIYMHDGQNLFEDETSYGGHSWGIYESKQELIIHERMEDMIIVGIDNSPLRMSEYSPWKNNFKISDRDVMDTGGQGDLYAQFIVETVLPFIEEKYRINKNQRYVAGSSMGAYISMYIISKYPKEFIGAGIFSLASWFNEEPFIDYIDKSKLMKNSRFFISIGRHETSSQANKDFNQIYLNNSRRL